MSQHEAGVPGGDSAAPTMAAADRLLPRRRHPYYVVAPRYLQASAGIKALHMLCHALNRAGETAYLVIHPFYPRPDKATHPYLLTPLLDAQRVQTHFADGVCPITVYSESVRGNPFDAPLVARYLLHFPGHLGGDACFADAEIGVAYSEAIAQAVPGAATTLFMPVSDPALFSPPPPGQPRSGSCFYAAKYQSVHQAPLFDVTRDSVEITRLRPDSQTPEQIAELFRRSELFYCYENSALIIEALLCGCPVVMLPNPYLDRSIGDHEIGWDGIAWGADAAEVARAKATVTLGRARYMACFARFEQQLHDFIALTQARAARTAYTQPVHIEYLRPPGLPSRLHASVKYAWRLLRDHGVRGFWRNAVSRLQRAGVTLP